MIPEPGEQTVFEAWYGDMNVKELVFEPIYRNLLNTNITLNLNSRFSSRHSVHERRLDALVIPQIDSFTFEILAIENDTVANKRYAYIKLYLRTALTKDSEVENLSIEIRIGEGATYSLSELVDGNFLSFYDLPPLVLLQVKGIDPLKCKVIIGPVDSVEI